MSFKSIFISKCLIEPEHQVQSFFGAIISSAVLSFGSSIKKVVSEINTCQIVTESCASSYLYSEHLSRSIWGALASVYPSDNWTALWWCIRWIWGGRSQTLTSSSYPHGSTARAWCADEPIGNAWVQRLQTSCCCQHMYIPERSGPCPRTASPGCGMHFGCRWRCNTFEPTGHDIL